MNTCSMSQYGILQLNVLRELNLPGMRKVAASSCAAFKNVPTQLMDRCLDDMAQKGLIDMEKRNFIGHKATIIQITAHGRDHLHNLPSQE